MSFFSFLFEIFLENGEQNPPRFHPLNLTDHYKGELGDLFLDAVYISTTYSQIEQHIQKYKYLSDKSSVDLFVDLLVKVVEEYDIKTYEGATIMPVPMHWSRYIFRGFHHTRYIAKILAKVVDLPMHELLSTSWTKHQSKLSRVKRLENKKNTFTMRYRSHVPETVILFDDVISTGSTANECAKVLKQAGVKNVIGIFLASNL